MFHLGLVALFMLTFAYVTFTDIVFNNFKYNVFSGLIFFSCPPQFIDFLFQFHFYSFFFVIFSVFLCNYCNFFKKSYSQRVRSSLNVVHIGVFISWSKLLSIYLYEYTVYCFVNSYSKVIIHNFIITHNLCSVFLVVLPYIWLRLLTSCLSTPEMYTYGVARWAQRPESGARTLTYTHTLRVFLAVAVTVDSAYGRVNPTLAPP